MVILLAPEELETYKQMQVDEIYEMYQIQLTRTGEQSMIYKIACYNTNVAKQLIEECYGDKTKITRLAAILLDQECTFEIVKLLVEHGAVPGDLSNCNSLIVKAVINNHELKTIIYLCEHDLVLDYRVYELAIFSHELYDISILNYLLQWITDHQSSFQQPVDLSFTNFRKFRHYYNDVKKTAHYHDIIFWYLFFPKSRLDLLMIDCIIKMQQEFGRKDPMFKKCQQEIESIIQKYQLFPECCKAMRMYHKNKLLIK